MIKIIKEAPKEYVTTCKHCGCQFSYELKDVDLCNIVKCPNCDTSCEHILDENIDKLVDTSKYDNRSNNTNSSVFTKDCHNCIHCEDINGVCKDCVVCCGLTPSRRQHNITTTISDSEIKYPPGSCITCKNRGRLFTEKPCKDCYNGDKWEEIED